MYPDGGYFMRTYCGLEYSLKIKNIITETIKTAKKTLLLIIFLLLMIHYFLKKLFSSILILYLISK